MAGQTTTTGTNAPHLSAIVPVGNREFTPLSAARLRARETVGVGPTVSALFI
jgi:hypothetical protein